jgi:uncharacterized membrane protein YhaH (DUF805 family)
MISIFSIRGRIGRAKYIVRLLFSLAVILLGFAIPILVGLLSVPWGIGQDETALWSEASAEFVDATLGKIPPKWTIFAFLIIGIRIQLCAVVQRARDLGIEMSTVFEVPLHWMNPFSKAHCGHLLASPGRPTNTAVAESAASSKQ